MTLVRVVPFIKVFAEVQLSAAKCVVYGHLTTLDDSLSLNQYYHPLITQLSFAVFFLISDSLKSEF